MIRKSHTVMVGGVPIGGGNPIVIQSMTNTDTANSAATVAQVKELVAAGSELVRVTVNNEDAARAVPHTKDALRKASCDVPIIGDFHFNGHILLTKYPECAAALDKYRINPGNVGTGKLHDKNFASIIKVALKNNKPVRIGVNWGSLDHELLTKLMDENSKKTKLLSDQEVLIRTLVQSALLSAQFARNLGMPENKIILGVKVSELPIMVEATRRLAAACKYPLHLGLTEAGSSLRGVIASSAALGILLHGGIGDTIRVSLTPKPGAPRSREVEVCKLLLQSLRLRHFRPDVTSCPGCGRTGTDMYLHLTNRVNEYIGARLPDWKRTRKNIEKLRVAIMGCVVNGPGESSHADIAISLPGKSEEPLAVVFVRGKLHKTLRGEKIEKEFLDILEQFVMSL